MWFEYSQNNSGGSFVYDHDAGISEWVFVEADSLAEADSKFESIGGYFNGGDEGYDCDCCGDRWYSSWMDDGMIFDEMKERVFTSLRYSFSGDQNAIYIHFKDGSFIGDKDKKGSLMTNKLKELES